LIPGPWVTAEAPFESDGEHVLWAPHVIFREHESKYYMFYCSGAKDRSPGVDPYTQPFSISLRTSKDLKSWSPRVQLQPDPFEDGYQARDPMILWNSTISVWVMYYTSTERPGTGHDAGHHIVAYRTSGDLTRWSNRGIAYTDLHVGSDYGPTESPFVVQRGDDYYLFIGPRPYDRNFPGGNNWKHPGYAGTDVFRSKHWNSWTNADYVGHIDAHALEVVKDVDGAWYVSHSGIFHEGLFLARLDWL
jgi:arabinan endo-1,5-alpha-L-arabinosidase